MKIILKFLSLNSSTLSSVQALEMAIARRALGLYMEWSVQSELILGLGFLGLGLGRMEDLMSSSDKEDEEKSIF